MTERNVDVKLYQQPPEAWANTILYRLAEALGVEPDENGTLEADPDKILEVSVSVIKLFRRERTP